jgi:DNA-directed RNA polymerase specialized sigma24 family protein
MQSSVQQSLLVALAQSGDKGAFERLFLAIHPPLLRYIGGIVGYEQAEDVLQETFLQIYRKIRWLQEPCKPGRNSIDPSQRRSRLSF